MQADFIAALLQKVDEAGERAAASFSDLTVEQINWKPNAQSWSIAQCLHHLIITDSNYFNLLDSIVKGDYEMSFLEKYSPLSGFWGRLFVRMIQEKPGRKIPAPAITKPGQSGYTLDILAAYQENLRLFRQYIADCDRVDIEKLMITSPFAGIITFPLKNALQLLMQHEHRHIGQAIRLKESPAFPK